MKKILPAIGAGATALILSACVQPPSSNPDLTPSQLFEHQHGCHLDPKVGNEGGQCWKWMGDESTGIYVTYYGPKVDATYYLSHNPGWIDGGMVTVLPS